MRSVEALNLFATIRLRQRPQTKTKRKKSVCNSHWMNTNMNMNVNAWIWITINECCVCINENNEIMNFWEGSQTDLIAHFVVGLCCPCSLPLSISLCLPPSLWFLFIFWRFWLLWTLRLSTGQLLLFCIHSSFNLQLLLNKIFDAETDTWSKTFALIMREEDEVSSV